MVCGCSLVIACTHFYSVGSMSELSRYLSTPVTVDTLKESCDLLERELDIKRIQVCHLRARIRRRDREIERLSECGRKMHMQLVEIRAMLDDANRRMAAVEDNASRKRVRDEECAENSDSEESSEWEDAEESEESSSDGEMYDERVTDSDDVRSPSIESEESNYLRQIRE